MKTVSEIEELIFTKHWDGGFDKNYFYTKLTPLGKELVDKAKITHLSWLIHVREIEFEGHKITFQEIDNECTGRPSYWEIDVTVLPPTIIEKAKNLVSGQRFTPEMDDNSPEPVPASKSTIRRVVIETLIKVVVLTSIICLIMMGLLDLSEITQPDEVEALVNGFGKLILGCVMLIAFVAYLDKQITKLLKE